MLKLDLKFKSYLSVKLILFISVLLSVIINHHSLIFAQQQQQSYSKDEDNNNLISINSNIIDNSNNTNSNNTDFDSTSDSNGTWDIPTIPPTETQVTITKSAVNFTWASTGSYDHKPYYNASISFDGVNWQDFCYYSETTNCIFDSLVSNTTYRFRISDINYDDPVDVYYNYTTLEDSTSRCILEEGDNACYGNGHCVYNQCFCDDGWGGDLCQIKTFNNNRYQLVSPDQTKPKANLTMIGIGYTMKLTNISEYTNEGWRVNTVDFSALQWRFTALEDEAVEIYTSDTVIRKRWIYQANLMQQPIFKQSAVINITFTQYAGIQGVTDNHYYSFPYAGHIHSIALGALKYDITIEGWRFQSEDNILEINSIVTPAVGGKACMEWSHYSIINGDRTTALSLIDAGGNMVYGQYPNRANIDSIPRSVVNTFMENTEDGSVWVSTKLPFFASQAYLDPDLNLLITGGDYSRCKYPSKTRFTLMVTFGFSLGILLAATSLCIMVRYQQSRIRSENYQNLDEEDNSEVPTNSDTISSFNMDTESSTSSVHRDNHGIITN